MADPAELQAIWQEVRETTRALATHLGECSANSMHTGREIKGIKNTIRWAALGIISTQAIIIAFLFARLMGWH